MSAALSNRRPAGGRAACSIMSSKKIYTCSDYREEMRLIGLRKRLGEAQLSRDEKKRIEAEIAELEKALQLD